MSSRRFASSVIVLSALSLGCGARSGIECFGESCSRRLADEDEDEEDGTGFAPPDEGAPDMPLPGSGGGAGSGGRPERPRPVDDPPREQIPTDTPIDMPVDTGCVNGGTYFGSIDVTTEGMLRTLEGCDVVDGDLVIFGGGISNLRPLSQLRLVTGAFRIVSYQGMLDGLESLQSVDALSIQNINASNLEPLRGLRQIGGGSAFGGTLEVVQNPGLTSLAGLGSLVQVGSIVIGENPALTSLAGLSVPAELDSVSIQRNALLADVDGLAGLLGAENIQILDCFSLRSLAGLQNLQSAGSLAFVANPSLTTLDLPVASIDVFFLEQVAATTLSGLSGITRIGKAIIQNNPNLLEIDRLAPIQGLTELSVINNPSLVQMPNFVGVVDLENLHVRNNASLVIGPGFPLVAEAGTVLIGDHPLLTSVTGFATLQVVRSLDISGNASLAELDLGALVRARNGRITCNPALPESSLDNLRLVVEGSMDVWGNLGSPTPCL